VVTSSGHSWNLSRREAVALQSRLSPLVEATDGLGSVRRIAGVDVAYHGAARDRARAAVVVLKTKSLEEVERATAFRRVSFPYVPGLLAFREAPAMLEALAKVESSIDLLLVDGHGLAHPRRFGLACHVGVLTGLATVGVAKRRFVGGSRNLGQARGAWERLYHDGEVVGAVVRTRSEVTPVFVSIGHRVSLETAVALVLAAAPRFRVPEPLRRADALARGSA
jgi:deoxyribonuclease V